MPPITEGTIPSGSVRFKLNGLTKSINLPVTGAELHRLAGNPATLITGDVAVPNTSAPFVLTQDAELVSTFVLRDNRRPVEHSPKEHSPVEERSPVEHSPEDNVLSIDEARVAADKLTLANDEKRVVADTTTFHKL